MKTLYRLAAGGMMLATAFAANAAPISTIDPASNNGDLLFWVSNTATQVTSTFVLSANQVNSYFSTTTATSHATAAGAVPYKVTGEAGFSYSFAGDTALQSLISGAGADVRWGIIGGANPGGSANLQDLGATRFVLTSQTDASVTAVAQSAISSGIPNGYAQDVSNLVLSNADQTGLPAGVTGTSAGIFGTPTSVASGVSLYGADSKEPVAVGSTAFKLYGVTSNGTQSGKAIVYNLGTASFDGQTLSFSGYSAVPLPAAVWLFGSGLLGLLGIGRRRDTTVA